MSDSDSEKPKRKTNSKKEVKKVVKHVKPPPKKQVKFNSDEEFRDDFRDEAMPPPRQVKRYDSGIDPKKFQSYCAENMVNIEDPEQKRAEEFDRLTLTMINQIKMDYDLLIRNACELKMRTTDVKDRRYIYNLVKNLTYSKNIFLLKEHRIEDFEFSLDEINKFMVKIFELQDKASMQFIEN